MFCRPVMGATGSHRRFRWWCPDDSLVVIDPGMVSSRSVILDPIGRLGYQPEDVTDVVISHHHPDHTINIALFPNARVHDHWAIYDGDSWDSRPAEGFEVAPDVTLWETPGHTAQDITTIVRAGDDLIAFTHLWWYEPPPSTIRLCTHPDTASRRPGAGSRSGDPDRPRPRRALRPRRLHLPLASEHGRNRTHRRARLPGRLSGSCRGQGARGRRRTGCSSIGPSSMREAAASPETSE